MSATPFYMVWRENGNPPKFRHPDVNRARFEAERLARMYPGERFFVLASIGDVRVSDTHWTAHNQFDAVVRAHDKDGERWRERAEQLARMSDGETAERYWAKVDALVERNRGSMPERAAINAQHEAELAAPRAENEALRDDCSRLASYNAEESAHLRTRAEKAEAARDALMEAMKRSQS